MLPSDDVKIGFLVAKWFYQFILLSVVSFSLPNHGESMSALDECWYEEDDDDDEGSDSPKVKKTVRFSDTVHKQLFRYHPSNSSKLHRFFNEWWFTQEQF